MTKRCASARAVLAQKDEPVVLNYGSGRRARSAAEPLRQLGHHHVTAMTAGHADLKAADHVVAE